MEKIVDIIESIAHEKGLDILEVRNTVTLALVKTAKKVYGNQYEYGAEIDPATKTTTTFGSLPGSVKWTGGVLAPNGKIYGIPCKPSSVAQT